MNNPQITRIPIAKTGMLVRKPVEHVFEAIVNPDITTKFWFSKGSGRLETGKAAKWDWESHDVSIEVTPKVVEPNKRVVIEWPGYSGDDCGMDVSIHSGWYDFCTRPGVRMDGRCR
jgi:hypothetical protein